LSYQDDIDAFSEEDRLSPHSPRDVGIDHKSRKRSQLIFFLWLALGIGILFDIGLMFFLPFRFPSGVNSFGAIASMHKWVLTKGTDGQLTASTFNYKTGLSEGYRVTNFPTGSSVYFSLRSSLVPGQVVAIGDTIGSIYSIEMQDRRIVLNGQLTAAQRLLAVNATGQKSAIVDEAQQKLDYAKRRLGEHQKVLARSQKLFEANLISQGEYELVQSQTNVLQDNIRIAAAGLETARTGAKPEQLELARANIATLENEIAGIKSSEATNTLTAPISGTIAPSSSVDDLLTITDTSKYVALIPVKWTDYTRLASTSDPRVTLMGFSRALHGRIVAVNKEIQILGGQRVFMATALLEGSPDDLMPGMLAKCRIECKPMTAIEYLRRLFGLVADSN
jgi:hypothetical protein